MGSLLQLEHPVGPKFSSILLYLLPFLRYHPLPVSKVTWAQKLKMVTVRTEHPAGLKFSSVSFYLWTVFGYRQLPVSRVMWPQKLKMAENGLAWQFSTQWVPNFCPFHSILTVFEITSTSCFEGHVTLEIENGRKWVPMWIDHLAVPKFVVHFALSFTVFEISSTFLFQTVTWPRKLKNGRIRVSLFLQHPAGPKFSFVLL